MCGILFSGSRDARGPRRPEGDTRSNQNRDSTVELSLLVLYVTCNDISLSLLVFYVTLNDISVICVRLLFYAVSATVPI